MSKKKFGDRRDARRVRNLNPMFSIMSRINPVRCDSDVYINEKVDITKLVKYVEKEKKKDPENRLTYFHVFSYAIARTLYLRPKLNRYIKNYKTYERDIVSIGFTAKVSFDDKSEELLSLIKIPKNYVLTDVKNALAGEVKKIRGNKKNGGTDKLLEGVFKMPGFILRPLVGIIKFMDRHDLLPESICDSVLYYSSVLMSNIGTLKCDAVYHHLSDFGTNSIVFLIGEIKEEYVLNEKGKAEKKHFVTFGVNIDERIGDGYYLIKSIKLFEHILQTPKLFEDTVSDPVEIK